MNPRFATLATIIALLTPVGVASFAADSNDLKKASVLLSIEPLLVDAQGVHPLQGPAGDLQDAARGGAYYQTIKLADSDALVYAVRYSMPSSDRIELKLERKIASNSQERKLPDLVHTMSPFESWTIALTEKGSADDLRLRVAPVFRALNADESFEETKLGMQLDGGPLIIYGATGSEDRVVHRAVNVEGAQGVNIGIPGVGVMNLSARRFPGSTSCGWIRGSEITGRLDGQAFSIYSRREILPEDPSRPDKGWILYGKLERVAVDRASYGSFDPSKP